ncbi:MAG TPA: hypothetical protein VG826_36230 [Pirellulales bacterium]|nr:hypothetical protein [Pirellulales bacterium]
MYEPPIPIPCKLSVGFRDEKAKKDVNLHVGHLNGRVKLHLHFGGRKEARSPVMVWFEGKDAKRLTEEIAAALAEDAEYLKQTDPGN